MTRLADALERFLLPLVVTAAAAGIAFPGLGRRLDAANAILATLAVLVFCTGACLTLTDIAALKTASRRLLLVLAVTTVALPTFAWLASRLVSGPALRGGMLAAGVAPTEVASVALTGLAGGEAALAAALLAGFHRGHRLARRADPRSPGRALDDLTARAAGHAGSGRRVAAGSRLRDAIPRSAWRARAASAADHRRAQPAGPLWAVASELHIGVSDASLVAAVLVYLACGAALGWLLGTGAAPARRTAVFLSTAMRDFAVAAGIAASAFGAPAAAPLGVYGILVLVFGSAAANLIRRRRDRSGQPMR